MLERANLPLRPAEALFFYLAGVAVVALLLVRDRWPNPGRRLIGVGRSWRCIPPAVLSFLAQPAPQGSSTAQLPDTLQLLAGTLRAGYSLMQGVEAVSQEVAEPMGQELRRVVTEARLGRPLEEALDGVAERMESGDFAWAVMAIRIQREVGGNLAELLLTVAETMTERERLRRDVNALTAEGRVSAIVLGILPVGLGLFMYVGQPRATWTRSSSETIGKILLGRVDPAGVRRVLLDEEDDRDRDLMVGRRGRRSRMLTVAVICWARPSRWACTPCSARPRRRPSSGRRCASSTTTRSRTSATRSSSRRLTSARWRPFMAGLTGLGRRFTPVGYVDKVRREARSPPARRDQDAFDRFLAIRVVTVVLAPIGAYFAWKYSPVERHRPARARPAWCSPCSSSAPTPS